MKNIKGLRGKVESGGTWPEWVVHDINNLVAHFKAVKWGMSRDGGPKILMREKLINYLKTTHVPNLEVSWYDFLTQDCTHFPPIVDMSREQTDDVILVDHVYNLENLPDLETAKHEFVLRGVIVG